ncbi:sulfotransferase [Funiculus sociatus GB2-A5]|uniref:Sulfotransferase n=1 Tax=Funiculus sociatus GB2-A5 TaxID=2933946 RepID=A0ABV0JPS5_9CYAN|nr:MULTISPECIES: sulfotransferase [unclassified Trichocoleus]MBD1907635.1 sulfotransferase [Trichocoleus sp. FACHB-832]MBD2007160.1 sulfotransferase [Trichocoleus sp. FACHB-40]MBD2062943.1 sulfotransferase [Trichocoleus sp. FACHB-6]
MSQLFIILSPPRSFSSVVSTMIGQHPQLYGFPELHLFVGDTIDEVIKHHETRRRPEGPPGLLRTIAEIHSGAQTTSTVLKARLWLDERRDWPVKKLYDYMLEKISPQIGVEKSPITVVTRQFIERAYSCFPTANYLHLTRHPISARKSIIEMVERKRKATKVDPSSGIKLDPLRFWFNTHRNIMNFCNTLPLGQSIRIKGEDVLSEPDLYLPQIADWLGLRTDSEAIEAMKHPENSPYARVGPIMARGGNDVKFMHSPALRPGKIREPSLKDELEKGELKDIVDDEFAEKLINFAKQLGYR